MARITSITVAGPDDPIYTGRWVISKQGPPKLDKADDMEDKKRYSWTVLRKCPIKTQAIQSLFHR